MLIRIRCGVCKADDRMERIDRGENASLWVCVTCGASEVLENYPHPITIKRKAEL